MSLALATWWVVGDLSEPDGTDYMFKPVSMPPGAERLLGIAAFAGVGASLALIVGRARAGEYDRRWRNVLLEFAMAAVMLGFGWRVMTAAVGGANIGGGLILLFGAPFVVAMVALAAWQSVVIRNGSSGRSVDT